MTEAEARILKNQIDIMWTLHCALGKLLPDLVGRGGEFDMMRGDLAYASKETKKLVDASPHTSTNRGAAAAPASANEGDGK
jgi:hypothetical protein